MRTKANRLDALTKRIPPRQGNRLVEAVCEVCDCVQAMARDDEARALVSALRERALMGTEYTREVLGLFHVAINVAIMVGITPEVDQRELVRDLMALQFQEKVVSIESSKAE